MAQFRKRLVIEAVQFNGRIEHDIVEFFGNTAISVEDGKLVVPTLLEEWMKVREGNWIIKGVTAGAFYSCSPEIFEATYESVS